MGASSVGERDNYPPDAHRIGTDSASICKVHDAASHPMPHEVCAPTFVPELDRSFPKTDFDGKVDLHRVWLRSRPGQATSNEHHDRSAA